MKCLIFALIAGIVLTTAATAEPITTSQAKLKAEEMLSILSKAEAGAFNDRVLQDASTYMREVDAPVNRALSAWPDRTTADGKAIEPYALCAEAGMALYSMAESRKNFGKDSPFVEKPRMEYLDKKVRCATSIKTGTYTPKK